MINWKENHHHNTIIESNVLPFSLGEFSMSFFSKSEVKIKIFILPEIYKTILCSYVVDFRQRLHQCYTSFFHLFYFQIDKADRMNLS